MIHMVQWWCSYWDQCSHKLIFFLYAVHIYFVYNYKYIPSKYSILFTALTTYLDCKQILWVYRNLLHYCGKRLPFIGYSTCKEKVKSQAGLQSGNYSYDGSKSSGFFFRIVSFYLQISLFKTPVDDLKTYMNVLSFLWIQNEQVWIVCFAIGMGLQVSNPNAAQWLTS